MKYSKQRELVLAIVQKSMNHPTAEEIYEKAREELPNISLGTVYRNLNFLVEKGLILQLKGLGEKDHFDKTLYDHGHLYCTVCKKIYDICDDSIVQLKEKVYEHMGFETSSYIISMTGICKPCKGKEGNE